jgi:prepilin-type N-terminal cleavage/methylation domain-containing protein
MTRAAYRSGVTLIEVLVTIIIGSIAMLAMAGPFVIERSMWSSGRDKTTAQREAQLALRAIGSLARESGRYEVAVKELKLYSPDKLNCQAAFAWDSVQQSMLWKRPCGAAGNALIKSGVTGFSVQAINNQLFGVQIQVQSGNEQETLVTEFFLRNA